MNKIDEIRQLISENRHADALNICVENFSPDEYTQEEIEQVYLWRIECILGTILISEFGIIQGNGVRYEDMKGDWEYNPEYTKHLDLLKTCIMNLIVFVKAQPTDDAKLDKYHKFQNYLLNLITERVTRSINKYGELIQDSKSWENWVRFNLGICFLDVFISRCIYAIGIVELHFVANDTKEFKSALDQIDYSKMQIQSIYNCSSRLNDIYESISEGDYILEDDADKAFELLNTVMQIERYLIKQFETYTGTYSEKYTNEEFVIVKKKVLLSLIVTALNAQVVGKGRLIFAEDLRKELYEEACALQEDINPHDPNFDGVGIIQDAPIVYDLTERSNNTESNDKISGRLKKISILYFCCCGVTLLTTFYSRSFVHLILSVILLILAIIFLKGSKNEQNRKR